jgi:uncharacterized membrane protein
MSSLPLWLFFVAFGMILIGSLLVALASFNGSNSGFSVGGVILIGPIPIILGTGPYSLVLTAVAVVLTIVALAFYVIFRRRF